MFRPTLLSAIFLILPFSLHANPSGFNTAEMIVVADLPPVIQQKTNEMLSCATARSDDFLEEEAGFFAIGDNTFRFNAPEAATPETPTALSGKAQPRECAFFAAYLKDGSVIVSDVLTQGGFIGFVPGNHIYAFVERIQNSQTGQIVAYEIFHNHPNRNSGKPNFLSTPDLKTITNIAIRMRTKFKESFAVSISAIVAPDGFSAISEAGSLLGKGFIGERYTSKNNVSVEAGGFYYAEHACWHKYRGIYLLKEGYTKDNLSPAFFNPCHN